LLAGDLLAELGFESSALALCFGDPAGSEGGVDVVVEELVVLRDTSVEVGDPGPEAFLALDALGVGFGDAVEGLAGVLDVVVVEQMREPSVEAGGDGRFSNVDAAWVPAVGLGVVGGELAAVVGLAVTSRSSPEANSQRNRARTRRAMRSNRTTTDAGHPTRRCRRNPCKHRNDECSAPARNRPLCP
jgi:hypothetical protein